MLNHLWLFTAVLLVCLVSVSCRQKQDLPAPPMVLPVAVVKVKPLNIPNSVEVIAQIEGAKEIEVKPRVGGVVLQRLYTEGTVVRAGQVLFLLDPDARQIAVQQTKAKWAEQSARLEQAVREENRLKNLLSKQAISQREYDNALTDSLTAKANLEQALADLKAAEFKSILYPCHSTY